MTGLAIAKIFAKSALIIGAGSAALGLALVIFASGGDPTSRAFANALKLARVPLAMAELGLGAWILLILLGAAIGLVRKLRR